MVLRSGPLALGLLALLLALSGAASAQEPEQPPAPDTLSGMLTTVYEDPRPGSRVEPDVEYTLTEDSDRATELALVLLAAATVVILHGAGAVTSVRFGG